MKSAKGSWRRTRICLAALVASLAFASWFQKAQASDALSEYAISLNPYSNDTQWVLRGVNARSGFTFGVRQDERVESLKLDLTMSYSAELLEDLSHLNVLLNGKVISTLPLPKNEGSEKKHLEVDLPFTDLEPYNSLELQLIGHYTMDCEDPLHESLWAIIDQSSRLMFEVERLALPDDLGILPAPFFDARDLRMQKVQFVGRASDKRLESLGILASWLGALASYRGTEFTASSDSLPSAGHAIVVLGSDESLPGVSIPEIDGPTLAMRTNPNDPKGKILLVMGRDDEEIRTAAVSLALGAQSLSGATAQVTEIQTRPRKPYDAPNWLPTDRPVYLGELSSTDGLTVRGFDPPPVNLAVRLPPDLSNWRSTGAPLDLRYRYTSRSDEHDSTLAVLINQQFVKELKLGDSYEGAWGALTQVPGLASQTIPLPLSLLESQAELQFKFNYPAPFRNECAGSMLDTRVSAIDPSSTIDLSKLPHHMAMPDLAAFRTAGFPYSRMADLSETVVLLSDTAGEHGFASFLTVLGKIGQTTGLPATGLTVQREATDLENKDLLIVASDGSMGIPTDWARYLPSPAPVTSQKGWFANFKELLPTNPFSNPTTSRMTPPADGVYVAGFESPVTDGRSVVVIAGSEEKSMQQAVQFMLFDNAQAQLFQGSLVSVRNDRITSLSSEQTYYVGSLGLYQTILWFLSGHPSVLFVIFLIGAVLTAVVLFLSLRARARGRLMVGASDENQPHDKN